MVSITYTEEFKRMAKAFAKKYRSFEKDYATFLAYLEANPFCGVSLGHDVYKTRMAIASKGKGKSGGARVLSYNVKMINPDCVRITLLSIYDKSELDNVSDKYIKSLVEQIEKS